MIRCLLGTVDFARLVRVRRASGPSWSPDGRRLAFVSNATGAWQAYVVPLSGGVPAQLTFGSGGVGLVEISPDGERLLVGADNHGDERVQLAVMPLNGGPMVPLTHDLGAMHPSAAWSPDGRRIAYAGNERDPRHLDLHVVGADGAEPRRVLEVEGIHQVDGWSPDGRSLLVSRRESFAQGDVFTVDTVTGAARHLTPHVGSALFQRPRPSPDGRSVYLLSDLDADFLCIWRVDLATGKLERVLDAGWDVDDLATSPDGRWLAYAVNVDGWSQLWLLDLESRQTRCLEHPPGVVTPWFIEVLRDGIVWSPDGARLALTFATAREDAGVRVIEVTGPRVEGVGLSSLTSAIQDGIRGEDLVEPELVHYPTFDGRLIPALLYRHSSMRVEGGSPAIVHIHGGPASQALPMFDPVIQYLVQCGYVVLAPNVRGSSGYGKAYMALDDIELRMDSVADARAAAEWLVASGWAHPRRIAAFGSSYGGFMVLASLCTYPETWAAGVDLAGQASWVTFLENTHPFRRRRCEVEYGSLERDRAFLERISPLRHADRIRSPLLAVHGEQDPRVPVGETQQIVSALEARGVPVEFIRLPDEGHGISKLANQLRVYPEIVRFLDRHLR